MNSDGDCGSSVDDGLIAACIGIYINAGSTRAVYEHQGKPELVIKKALTCPPSDNLIEWTVWRHVRNSAMAERFGRIEAISESGRYLVMEKLNPIGLRDYASTPDVPPWLADVKPSSFGRSATGLIKVMDYGSLNLDLSRLIRRHWQRD